MERGEVSTWSPMPKAWRSSATCRAVLPGSSTVPRLRGRCRSARPTLRPATSSIFAPWSLGAAVSGWHYARFDARRTLETVARCGVTTFCAPPTVWRMLVCEDLAAYRTALREVVWAGEPLNPEVIGQVRQEWGLTLRDGYGQTETTAMVANSRGQRVEPGASRPLPRYRWRCSTRVPGERRGSRSRAVPLHRHPAAGVQAVSLPRVRRSAQDDLGQDSPHRVTGLRSPAPHSG
jgi:hypothetical protein